MPYAIVEGSLINASTKTPKEGKPFINLHVLQNVDDENIDPELVRIKDFNLNNRYQMGSFKALCKFQSWNMGDNSGLSVQVVQIEKNDVGSEKNQTKTSSLKV